MITAILLIVLSAVAAYTVTMVIVQNVRNIELRADFEEVKRNEARFKNSLMRVLGFEYSERTQNVSENLSPYTFSLKTKVDNLSDLVIKNHKQHADLSATCSRLMGYLDVHEVTHQKRTVVEKMKKGKK